MATKRFKITAIADFGRERFVEKVVGAMKVSQTNMIIHTIDAYYDGAGRPFRDVARIEIPGNLDLARMKEWTLDTLRLYYDGPPFVVMVEDDTDPLPGGASLLPIP